MLSIIISSYQPDYFSALEKNIAETCGMPYEIIKIDNPGVMGICEAYNKGAEKAIYDNLLFLHEDVLFETNEWGSILIKYLQNENVGCIGLAGSNYISHTPAPWWVIQGYSHSHLAHFNKTTQKRNDYTFSGDNNGLLVTKILDGVFIACKKEVWEENLFNEDLRGFHGYDISFSLTASKNFQNYITNRITLLHFSSGKLSDEWMKNLIKAYEISSHSQIDFINSDTELVCFKYFADQLRHLGFPMKEKIDYLQSFISFNHLGLINWLKAYKKIKAIKKY